MQQTLLKWIESAQSRFPDSVYLQDAAEALTFREAAEKADIISSFLINQELFREPVAVITGRHVHTPVCYMGVAKAGCCYAPLDASMPDERLNQIIDNVQPRMLITDNESFEKASRLKYTGRLFCLEEILTGTADREQVQIRAEQITENFPLYIIFTSGSTGRPKGVVTSHHAMMNYLSAANEVLQITPEDVIGNQSPLDYIAAIRDMYFPLITGAKTVILPKNEFGMGAELMRTLNRYRVSILCWSAAGLELPARQKAFDEAVPKYLRKVMFSGAVISSKYLKEWQQHLPQVTFINQYGPTEATASCTYYVIQETVKDSTVLPIGRPYTGYEVMVLTEDDQRAQPGTVGEICVLGPGLALGYYNDPEKTEKSFVRNPLNTAFFERMYRTGDLGRLREDGNLEFCGRKDRQIKYMGHRVELDEIEGNAINIPGVSECCVQYDNEAGSLVMFFTGEASNKEIALALRKVLPGFMVPRKLIRLEQMPLLPNGKTDRKALEQHK